MIAGESSLHLSVVIPAYNESRRIGGALESICTYLSRQEYDWEIIVVDDGSTDQTATYVEATYPGVQVLRDSVNRGKGHAVRCGMDAATGKYRLFTDADGSTPIDELDNFWPEVESGADVVIGSRSLPDSRVEIRQAWWRENMGRAFNFIIKCIALTPFIDTQCGFKLFSAESCDVILPRAVIDGFAFDVEWLYIAQRHGFVIREVPIRWINSERSSVNAITDSGRMLLEAVYIRWRALRGKYR